MTRREPSRLLGVLLVLLLVLLLGLAGYLTDDEPADDQGAVAAAAAAAFGAAYATFEEDFAAASALSEEQDAGLVERTASIRAVRLAFTDFDNTVTTIAMPDGADEDVAAMHAAIEELIVTFDVQGATTTVAAYQEANPPAASAYKAARSSIQRVRKTLGSLLPAEPEPSGTASAEPLPEAGSLQSPVPVPYASGSVITGAVSWRAALLKVAAANVDPRYADNVSLGIREGWLAAFPGVLDDGSIVDAEQVAPTSGISGFAVTRPDPLLPASRENPPYLAFAVRDADGTCAGGVITGYPAMTTTTPVNPPETDPCTGLRVALAAGFPVD